MRSNKNSGVTKYHMETPSILVSKSSKIISNAVLSHNSEFFTDFGGVLVFNNKNFDKSFELGISLKEYKFSRYNKVRKRYSKFDWEF